MKKPKSVDDFISNTPQWENELKLLRKLSLDCFQEEAIKWMFPVYMLKGKNVTGLGGWKNYVGIWFFQGVFLKDEAKMLVNAQEGKTAGLRQWRFSSMQEIKDNQDLIKTYLFEARENQIQGRVVKPKKQDRPLVIPTILEAAFASNKELATAYENLTKSSKREYAQYISDAKMEATKLRRIDKIVPMILAQKGLHDAYK